METILVTDLIDVKSYNIEGGADIEIDDGRSSISISAPLDIYEQIYPNFTKRKSARKNTKKNNP